MLKTYRIIPLVFILFFFGFTLITVAPVFAEDSPEFVACQQIKPRDIQTLKNKKDCFRDLARALVTGGAVAQANGADSPEQVSTSPSGGEVAELNARIAESESQVATLTTTNAQLEEYLRLAREALEPFKHGEAELHLDAKSYWEVPWLARVLESREQKIKLKLERGTLKNILERLRSKVQINEKGVAHMDVLREKVKDHYCTSNALKKTHGPVWCDHMRVRLDAYARDVEDELLQIVREDKTLADYRETLEKSDRPELPVCEDRCDTLTGICAGPAPGIPCRKGRTPGSNVGD